MQCNEIEFNPMQENTIPDNEMQYNKMQDKTMQDNIMQGNLNGFETVLKMGNDLEKSGHTLQSYGQIYFKN